MTFPRCIRAPVATLAIAALGLVCGCGGEQSSFSSGRLFGPFLLGASKPPSASTPEGLLALLEWCWDHRNLERYETLFTEEFRATCGDATIPDLTRDDEIAAVRGVFERARLVRFDYASVPVVLPDSRPGKTPPWHRETRTITTALVLERGGRRFELDEVVRFYLVRGDSADLPLELKERGVRNDPERWFVERWESLGPTPGSRIGGDGSRVTPVSWCDLKRAPIASAR